MRLELLILIDWLKVKSHLDMAKSLEILGNSVTVPQLQLFKEMISSNQEISRTDKRHFYAITDRLIEEIESSQKIKIQLSTRNWMMVITGLTGLGSLIFMIYAIIFVPNLGNEKLIWHLLGVVETVAITIFSYYFGSSASSAKKTDLLHGNN